MMVAMNIMAITMLNNVPKFEFPALFKSQKMAGKFKLGEN